jgi:hypothetical protein
MFPPPLLLSDNSRALDRLANKEANSSAESADFIASENAEGSDADAVIETGAAAGGGGGGAT